MDTRANENKTSGEVERVARAIYKAEPYMFMKQVKGIHGTTAFAPDKPAPFEHVTWLHDKLTRQAQAAIKALAQDRSGDDGWINVDDNLPDMDEPVIGAFADGSWSIFMRSDDGEGWLWHRVETYGCYSPNPKYNEFDCDDDYQVRWWQPLLAFPPQTKQSSGGET